MRNGRLKDNSWWKQQTYGSTGKQRGKASIKLMRKLEKAESKVSHTSFIESGDPTEMVGNCIWLQYSAFISFNFFPPLIWFGSQGQQPDQGDQNVPFDHFHQLLRGGNQDVPKSANRYNISSASLVCPGVSYRMGMPDQMSKMHQLTPLNAHKQQLCSELLLDVQAF